MSDTASFIPGGELARALAQVLEPRVRVQFPQMPIALAFIGPGSDVMGFDTARSKDHDWGPRLTLVVPDGSVDAVEREFNAHVEDLLPQTVAGFPTRFSRHPDGTGLLDAGGSDHRVQITSVRKVLQSTLAIDSISELSDAVWLSTPMQALIELTAGEVFVDDPGELTEARGALGYYPDHLWRYLLAGLWMRIAQIQPSVGRCFESGDSVGAATIALGIVRDLTRIALVQSRQYVPYAKWLGTAAARTEIGQAIKPDLERAACNASSFQELEHAINSAGSKLIRHLNTLKLIAEGDPAPHQFFERPFMVLPAEEIALSLKASVADFGLDQFVKTLGGIDAMSDSTDALGTPGFLKAIRVMFEVP